ncbi:MAG: helix-turn-helix transcriptional regulator [Atribacterota bacterium]|nr:helix-turn-helix transcriptional regulator [Atribacterota bacterium]MDD4896475.1 helix-turn-helix transcriptional regulator [Atribacterota bacterium]MDD5637278.1 helix-turn-helix transcriptional regulator [Atribacterota bacterium]
MISGKTIGKNIKKMRVKLGLTRNDLAKKADIKNTKLTKIESGIVNKPSVQTMAKIAQALGVLIENLLNKSATMNKEDTDKHNRT